MILNFNVHNIFRFRVISENKRFAKYIENEFSFFKVEKVKKPDLVLQIGRFDPDVNDCIVINNKYYVKKNFLFLQDSYKVAKWKAQFDNLEKDKITVKFDGNYFADSFLVQYIIEPLMRFKATLKGFAILHSSCISDGSKAAIFIASKGVGKTSTILNFLDIGAIYMSDDFTIVSKDKKVWSYPTTIHLFDYNVKHCPFIRSKLSFKRKTELKMKTLIYKLTLKYAQFPVCISPLEIFPQVKIGNCYPLALAVVLNKAEKNKLRLRRIDNLQELVNSLVYINQFEDFHFLDYMMAYSYVFPQSQVAKRWLLLRKICYKIFQNILCYELTIPKYTSQVFKTLKNFLIQNRFKFAFKF